MGRFKFGAGVPIPPSEDEEHGRPRRTDPLREARAAAQWEDDRGRLLPGQRRRSRRRSQVAPHEPTLRRPSRTRICTSAWSALGPRLPGPVGGVGRGELERAAPLPELRHLPRGHLQPRTPSRVFDEELDRGADALARDYKRLMRANMAEEIDRFVGALDADAILPEDFATASLRSGRPAACALGVSPPRRPPPAPAPLGAAPAGRARPARLRLRYVRRAPARAPLQRAGRRDRGRRSARPPPAVSRGSSVGSARGRAPGPGSAAASPCRRAGPRRAACRCARPDPTRRARRRASGTPARRPRRSAPSASRHRGPAAEQGAQPARRREQAGRLEAAALEVALRRHVRAPGVGALHQLAAGQRARRLGQRADRVRAPASTPARRTRARRAGPRSPSRRSRPPSAKTVGRPRRSGARSSTSSCTSVAMWSSSTAAPQPRPAARRRRRWRTGTRASGAAACRPPTASRSSGGPARRRAPRPSPRAASRSPSSSGRAPAPPAASTAPSCACAVFMPAEPPWIAMIPPAVSTQRTSSGPRPRASRPAPRGPGSGARSRAGRCRRRSRRRTGPAPAPPGRTRAGRTTTAAASAASSISRITTLRPPAGHPRELAQAALPRSEKLRAPKPDRDRVELGGRDTAG